MGATADFQALVALYEQERDQYEAPSYKEQWTCEEFIEPLLNALGWKRERATALVPDGYITQDRHQDADSRRVPDYGCYVGGELKLYFEAKKPSLDLGKDKEAAFQIRNYGWNARRVLSVLTNFRQLAVYDCRVQPDRSDLPANGRVLFFDLQDLARNWTDVSKLVGGEAVREGSIESWDATTKPNKPTVPVDEAFLADIEAWRATLATDILKKNSHLDRYELTSAVQAIIDRIVFLRICEGRQIERDGELADAASGSDVYARMQSLFVRADSRYNSGLFHFAKEAGRAEEPDLLTPSLAVGDEVLREIIQKIYPPRSPYEFSAIPPAILGQIYEQFLGKTINIGKHRRISIEDRPEVKKSGGVVYTPQIVVKFIIQSAVAPLLEGLSPRQASGETKASRPIRILDPACGSGSFLIEVYDYLMRWYLQSYSDNPKRWEGGKNPRVVDVAGELRLTSYERKRILLTHLFGVDIDPQAVEVTKLALLLKVLEGENSSTLDRQLQLFQQRALPDLSLNIKCGNSLIGSDFAAFDMGLFEDGERLREINPFDWSTEWPEIFDGRSGGFDSVVGNPPYVLLQDEFRDDRQLAYFKSNYRSVAYKIDLYHLFVEKASEIACENGYFSYITPTNYLMNNYLNRLRRLLLDENRIQEITVVDNAVFQGRSVDTCITTAKAGKKTSEAFPLNHALPTPSGLSTVRGEHVDPKQVRSHDAYLFATSSLGDVWESLEEGSRELGSMAWVNFGKQLRNRKKFTEDVLELPVIESEKRGYRRCYTGRDINRWIVTYSGMQLLNSEVARSGGCWLAERHDAADKLLTRQIGHYPTFGIDPLGYHCLNTLFMINIKPEEQVSPYFLLGILNSAVLRGYWLARFWDRRRTFPKIKGGYLKRLPIRIPDLETADGLQVHDSIAQLAEQAVSHSSPTARGSAHNMTVRERALQGIERSLESEVAGLYGVDLRAVEGFIAEASRSV